jgi:hypothetical protein
MFKGTGNLTFTRNIIGLYFSRVSVSAEASFFKPLYPILRSIDLLTEAPCEQQGSWELRFRTLRSGLSSSAKDDKAFHG